MIPGNVYFTFAISAESGKDVATPHLLNGTEKGTLEFKNGILLSTVEF